MPDDTPPPSSQRLVSLDALRGFDMCWILGLGGVVEHLAKRFIPGTPLAGVIADQFEHVDWQGFHFEDLIFPLFLFIAGVSMTLALPKRLEREGRNRTMVHLIDRALIIFVIGIIYSGGLSNVKGDGNWPHAGFDQIRWLGVLQRIGIASAVAGLMSLIMRPRWLLVSTIALLGGYYVMLRYISVPDFGPGDFAEGHNLTNYLDKMYLPGHKYDGDHDPEGILSTLPAIATALLGIFAGRWLQRPTTNTAGKVMGLLVGGAALIVLGWVWDPAFPIVKKLWTSSFVLVAGGWSAILLAVFYGIVDGLGWKRWATPFIWVGANPIALYLASGMGFFSDIGERLTGRPSADWTWVLSLAIFAVMLATARWLYRHRVFIRI